jgi:hypothetical protein
MALILLILFFAVGQPFGTLNVICIGLTALCSAVLAWTLYARYQGQSSLAGFEALAASVGALVVIAGSVLVIFQFAGWYLAGLYMAAGNAMIGLWLLGLSYSARQAGAWPNSLAVFGIAAGAIMILGFAAIPGIVRGYDAWNAAPWYVNYVGQLGGLGYLVLYPVWCLWLGRVLL